MDEFTPYMGSVILLGGSEVMLRSLLTFFLTFWIPSCTVDLKRSNPPNLIFPESPLLLQFPKTNQRDNLFISYLRRRTTPNIYTSQSPRHSSQILSFPASHVVHRSVLPLPLVVGSLYRHLLRGSGRVLDSRQSQKGMRSTVLLTNRKLKSFNFAVVIDPFYS